MENKITYLKVTNKNQVTEIVEKAKELKADGIFVMILVSAKLDDSEKNQLENTNAPILMLKDGQKADILDEIIEKMDKSMTQGIINVSIDDVKMTLEDTTYIGASLFETSVKTMENDVKNQIFNSISAKTVEKASRIWVMLTASKQIEFDAVCGLLEIVYSYLDEGINKIFSTNLTEESTEKIQVLIISN